MEMFIVCLKEFLGKQMKKFQFRIREVCKLPMMENDPTKIDEETTIKLIRHAIDQVNFIDTAYPYGGFSMDRPVKVNL